LPAASATPVSQREMWAAASALTRSGADRIIARYPFILSWPFGGVRPLPDLDLLRSRALEELSEAEDAATLDQWRISYLGRQGAVTQILRGLGELPQEEKRATGAAANALRSDLETALEGRRAEVERETMARLEADAIDVTLPGRKGLVGRLHPITQTLRDMLD